MMSMKTLSLLFLLTAALFAQDKNAHFNYSYSAGLTGINGRIFSAATDAPLPTRIVLTNKNGTALSSFYKNMPGHFTRPDGSFFIAAPAGEYAFEIYHGIDYLSYKGSIEVKPGKTLNIAAGLEPWLPLRALGWVTGDGHAHLYTRKNHDDDMLQTATRICRAQGIDFLCTNQGWAGYGDNDWRQGYARFSDEKFLLHYGAEMPKYRTGHTWWLGLTSTRGYFSAAMDSSYENQYFKIEGKPHWDFSSLPFPNIPDVYLVPRFKQAEDAVAAIPHPTSWWWEKRGAIEKYTTNVAEYLSYSLLAGKIWQAIVVMGYDSDHYFYQNLWFHVLNQGYRMTPVAELDGGYGKDNKFPYGSYRTYYNVGENFTIESIVKAARAGRTFVTSGPVVFATINEQFQPGDDLTADGTPCTLNIDAFASGDIDDFLSYIIVFRNGEIFKLWDIRDQKLRRVQKRIKIQERERAWYAIKVYGRHAQKSPALLDVMAVCDQIALGAFDQALDAEADICLTSPFYFWPEGKSEPSLLQSHIKLLLVDPLTRTPLAEATVEISVNGRPIKTLSTHDGRFEFDMPVNALLTIRAEGYPKLHRGLYLDYPPHQKIIESFANGNWLQQNNWRNILHPGQVPWSAFQFEETRRLLFKVDWTIEMKENERDALWDSFDALF